MGLLVGTSMLKNKKKGGDNQHVATKGDWKKSER